MTKISVSRSMTSDISEIALIRQIAQSGGPEMLNGVQLIERLEEIANDEPLVIEIFGLRPEAAEGEFSLREARALFGFTSAKYVEVEREREDATQQREAQRRLEARLEQHRQNVRAEMAAEESRWRATEQDERDRIEKRRVQEIEIEAQRRLRLEEGRETNDVRDDENRQIGRGTRAVVCDTTRRHRLGRDEKGV